MYVCMYIKMYVCMYVYQKIFIYYYRTESEQATILIIKMSQQWKKHNEQNPFSVKNLLTWHRLHIHKTMWDSKSNYDTNFKMISQTTSWRSKMSAIEKL